MAFSNTKPGFPSSPKAKDMAIREPNETTLTEKRREKLLHIRKREQMKDVLVQRFAERLNATESSAARKKENEEVVKSEVAAFMDNASITENNLKRLEKKIRNKVDSKDGGSGLGNDKDKNEEYSVVSSVKSASGVGKSCVSKSAKDSSLVADWRVLDDYAVYVTEYDEKKKLEKKRSAQKKMYGELTDQVTNEKSKYKIIKEEDKQFYEDSLKDLEQWKKTEDAKITTMREKCLVEKSQRDQQLEYDKKVRAEEEAADKKADSLAKQRLEKELELEKLKTEKKKVQQRKHMAVVFKENEEFQKQKAEQKKNQMDRDIAMMKLQARLQDEEEANRAAEKQARMKRQQDLMERMAKTVLAQQNANDKEGDIRTERQREEADKRALEAALNKEQMLQGLRNQTRDYHMKQMQERQDKKQQALEFRNAQAEVLVKDAERYNQQENAKSNSRKKKAEENQQEILNQITNRGKALREVQMSESEKKMNLGLLRHVNKVLKEAGLDPKKA